MDDPVVFLLERGWTFDPVSGVTVQDEPCHWCSPGGAWVPGSADEIAEAVLAGLTI